MNETRIWTLDAAWGGEGEATIEQPDSDGTRRGCSVQALKAAHRMV